MSLPQSPISPSVDGTSFHALLKSPEQMGFEDADAAEISLDEGRLGDDGSQEVEEADDVVGEGLLTAGGEALNARLSRISVSPTTRGRTAY